MSIFYDLLHTNVTAHLLNHKNIASKIFSCHYMNLNYSITSKVDLQVLKDSKYLLTE